MSGLLVSRTSIMSGLLGKKAEHTMTSAHPVTATMPDRMTKSMMSAPSPLKIFGTAKKKIRDIFVDVAAYVEESKVFVKGESAYRVLV